MNNPETNISNKKCKKSSIKTFIIILLLVIVSFLGFKCNELYKEVSTLNKQIGLLNNSNNTLKECVEYLVETRANYINIREQINDTLSGKLDTEKERKVLNQFYKIKQEKGELETTKKETENVPQVQEKTENTLPEQKEYSTYTLDTTSDTVWVGDSGTKYHRQNCRTLRGNKYEITLEEALSQGREACKVCY